MFTDTILFLLCVCVHMCPNVHIYKDILLSFLTNIMGFCVCVYLCDKVSFRPGTYQLDQAACPVSSRDLPVSASSVLRLQVCTPCAAVLHGLGGTSLSPLQARQQSSFSSLHLFFSYAHRVETCNGFKVTHLARVAVV